MKKLGILFFFLLMIPFLYGQGSSGTAAPIVLNQFGQPVTTAKVTICTTNPLSGTCSSLVSVYTDNTLSTLCSGTNAALNNLQFPSTGSGCSNPGRVDNFGNAVAFAAPGFYWCQYSGAGFVPYSQPCIFPSTSTGATPTGLANAGNTITLTSAGIHESTVNTGILGIGDQPSSPSPGVDDDCIFGPYVAGISSNGMVCTGANNSFFSMDNDVNTGRDGFQLTTGSNNGEILLQALNGSSGNDSQQTSEGWYSSGIMTSDMHALSVRCQAVGTAANPSVVNCTPSGGCPSVGTDGCAGGAFSCATNASGATCVIDTNRICVDTGSGCANSLQTTSIIFVTQVSDEGAVLGVTCNTTPTNFLISNRVNATSFTITLGAFSGNPLCFNYSVE